MNMINGRPCVTTSVCQGCLTYIETIKYFGIKNNAQCSGEVNNCPCVLCIIKSMCSKECEDFVKFKVGE